MFFADVTARVNAEAALPSSICQIVNRRNCQILGRR
jgi:hypothetical protein